MASHSHKHAFIDTHTHTQTLARSLRISWMGLNCVPDVEKKGRMPKNRERERKKER